MKQTFGRSQNSWRGDGKGIRSVAKLDNLGDHNSNPKDGAPGTSNRSRVWRSGPLCYFPGYSWLKVAYSRGVIALQAVTKALPGTPLSTQLHHISTMNYSIVIATRNRLKALQLSVPRMIAQSRPPTQLIVVDSSDDHTSVADAVRQIVQHRPIQLIIKQSERGLTLQRNAGLELVNQPLVFFPDDDSIWFPEVAKEILAIYEKDESRQISAVCGVESPSAPDDLSKFHTAYRMARSDRFKQPLVRLRKVYEKRVAPEPCRILGQSFFGSFPLPTTLFPTEIREVEWMTGFRMTFRTEVIRRYGFDVHLKRYALFEDRDASFNAWREGAVVAALRAKIYHYRSPENRDMGRRMGVNQLLNQAYLIAKHAPLGHSSRLLLRRFGYYKTFLYLLSAKDEYGRDRYRGAKAALAEIPAFVTAKAQNAAGKYQEALARCLPESV